MLYSIRNEYINYSIRGIAKRESHQNSIIFLPCFLTVLLHPVLYIMLLHILISRRNSIVYKSVFVPVTFRELRRKYKYKPEYILVTFFFSLFCLCVFTIYTFLFLSLSLSEINSSSLKQAEKFRTQKGKREN